MSDSPLITHIVVVPIAGDVNLALTSALSQTISDRIETIFSFNPSVLSAHLKQMIDGKGPAVRSYLASEDAGPAELIRQAISLARGQYITWSRVDEVSDPRRLERQLAASGLLQAPGVVTCDIRTHLAPLPRPQEVPALSEDAASITRSLLALARNSTGLFVHRSCLDAVGGPDPSFKVAYDLEFAVRLARRFSFAHVSANCLRSLQTAPEYAWRAEYERMCIGLFQSCKSLNSLVETAAAMNVVANPALLASYRSRLEAVVDERDLAVVCTDGGATPDIRRCLGAPRASYLEVRAKRGDVALLAEVAKRNTAKWVIVVESSALRPPETFAKQLLHALSRGVDGCLPPSDLDYRSSAPVVGVLFRQATLNSLDWSAIDSAESFWTEFIRHGRIDALAAVQQRGVPLLAAAFVDEQWYRERYPDVAKEDPREHFVTRGWREERSPNQWFDIALYMRVFPQLTGGDVNPVEHFLASPSFASDLMLRWGFDLRLYTAQRTGEGDASFEAVLGVLLPGLRWFTATIEARDVAAAVARIKTGGPGLTALVRSLSAQLEAFQTIVRLVDVQWYRDQYADTSRNIEPVEHYLCFGWHEGRDPNAWFDTAWYREHHPDLPHFGCSALEHFVRHASPKGNQPHPGFHPEWYASRYMPAGTPMGTGVFLHFLTEGARDGNLPHPRLDRTAVHGHIASVPPERRLSELLELYSRLPNEAESVSGMIDRVWYARKYPQGATDPMSHYIAHGTREVIDPNPYFDAAWYTAQNPSVTKSGLQPLLHFIRTGATEGMRPSPCFDHVWYGKRYLGAQTPTADALYHFLAVGIAQGAVPDPRLERPEYLEQIATTPPNARVDLFQRLLSAVDNTDNMAAALLDHSWYQATYGLDATEYRTGGWRELRDPNRWFDTGWYLLQNRDIRGQDICPLDHFVSAGAAEGRDPHSFFRAAWYARHYLGTGTSGAEALLHFVKIGLENGNAPDPRLATPRVQKHLRSVPPEEKPELLLRLIEALYLAQNGAVNWTVDDGDLWTVLLTRNFPPESVTGVLLLAEAGSASALAAAEGAAMALPPAEVPLYGLIEDNRLKLSESLLPHAATVTLKLPEQIDGLCILLRHILCRRVVLLSSELFNGGVVRAVRDTGVPVFADREHARSEPTQGCGRRSGRELDA